MFEFYTWSTPNCRKVSIMLEELGAEYRVMPVDITKDQQHTEEFLALNGNNKVPVLVDLENKIQLAESGAILLYLANMSGRFMPSDSAGYWTAVQWLMWQMSGLGPAFGQVHNFVHFNPGKAPFAEERAVKEALRIYGVLENQLARREYIAGDYSIADMAVWPWVSRFEWQKIDLNKFPNTAAWYLKVSSRPAVVRGYDVPHKVNEIPLPAIKLSSPLLSG